MKAERAEAGSARLGQARGQATGHRQPVHQGQDRIAEVVLPGRARPDVLDQPRAVRPDGTPDGGCCFRRAGHVMEAVKSHGEVVAVVAGQILRPRRPEFHVLQPVLGRPAAGTADRVLRGVQPVEPGAGESGRHRAHRHAGTAPDVCRECSGLQAIGHAVQGGQDQRHQGEPGPRFGHALYRLRGGRAEIVVCQPDPGTKGVGQPRDHLRRCGTAGERAGREPQAFPVIRQDCHGLRAYLESLAVFGADQASGGLAAKPLQQPAFLQPGGGRKPGRRHRPPASHGLVQAQPVAQVDHQRDHLALLIAPYPQCESA